MIQAWQVNFHPGKLDLGLLDRTDKLKGIFKLHADKDIHITVHAHVIHLRVQTKTIVHVAKQDDILVNPLFPSSHMLNSVQQ